jgi:hypothetical protein
MRQFEANLYAHVTNVCIFALMLGVMQDFDKTMLACLGMGRYSTMWGKSICHGTWSANLASIQPKSSG